MLKSSKPSEDPARFKYDRSLANSPVSTIRLLTILPKSPERAVDNRIRCLLSEYPLSECPRYETLSYCWGDGQEKRDIFCNGLRMSITANLCRALAYLRRSEERLFWIDQISINQENTDEKCQQVNMMRDIFKRSTRTIAWLGGPTPFTKPGFDLLHELYEVGVTALQNRANNAWAYLDSTRKDFFLDIMAEGEKFWDRGKIGYQQSKDVDTILSRPWFTRVWIIQEATVPEQITLVCGTSSMNFDHFIFATYIFHSLRFSEHSWNMDPSILQGHPFEMFQAIALFRYSYRVQNPAELDIVRFIYWSRSFQATDHRDRLYSLYGLTSTPVSDLNLDTKYTVCPRSVLSSSYVEIMRYDRSLRLLELSENNTGSDMPFWLPFKAEAIVPGVHPQSCLRRNESSVNSRIFARILRSVFADNIERLNPAKSQDPFEGILNNLGEIQEIAEQPQSTNCSINLELLENEILCVKGQDLDQISEISPVLNYSTSMESTRARRKRTAFMDAEMVYTLEADLECLGADSEFRSLRTTTRGYGRTICNLGKWISGVPGLLVKGFGPVMEEVTGTLAAEMYVDLTLTSRNQTHCYESGAAIEAAYRNIKTMSCESSTQDSSTLANASEKFEHRRRRTIPVVQAKKLKMRLDIARPPSLMTCLMYVWNAYLLSVRSGIPDTPEDLGWLTGRRLAWTARGHLARVPAETQVGDHIFDLKGAQMPFVLRPQSSDWKVIGPTYVDGMMNKEFQDDDALLAIRLV